MRRIKLWIALAAAMTILLAGCGRTEEPVVQEEIENDIVVEEVIEDMVEEVVVDEPIRTPINEEVISEVPKKKIQKPTFLNRLLNTLGDMVEKID